MTNTAAHQTHYLIASDQCEVDYDYHISSHYPCTDTLCGIAYRPPHLPIKRIDEVIHQTEIGLCPACLQKHNALLLGRIEEKPLL